MATQSAGRAQARQRTGGANIVNVTQYLTRAEDIADYAKVRCKFLGDARPTFMLLVIPQLVWPEILLEIEVIAAKVGTAGR